ncbi:MAG: hypothetical protein AAF514_06290 [Verrucomicrobiota bacterium]
MTSRHLTRRRFASHLGGMGMAAFVPEFLIPSAKAEPIGFDGFSGVKLAVATICADGFSNRQHQPSMKFLRGFGFENVELNLWYPEHLTPRYIRDLKTRCIEAGPEVDCLG